MCAYLLHRLLFEGSLSRFKALLTVAQLLAQLVFFSLEAANDLACGIVLVKCLRKFLASLLQVLPQSEDLQHLSVPLLLQELEHPRETHGVERAWLSLFLDLKLDKVAGGVHVLASDGALPSQAQLLNNQALFVDVTDK